MRKMLLAIAAVATLALTGPDAARAQGIPVHDASAVAQQMQQVAHALEQIAVLEQQIGEMQRQYEAITGVRDIGNLLNTGQARHSRDFIPREYEEAFSIIQDVQGGRYSDLSRAAAGLREAADLLNPEAAEAPAGQAISRRIGAAAGRQAYAEATYDRAGERLEHLNELTDAISGTTDLQEATALQSRLMSETGFALTDLSRQLALSEAINAENELSAAEDEARAANVTGGEIPRNGLFGLMGRSN